MAARTVIAFDFGIRRIGIAVGQELTKTATPLTTLRLSDKVSIQDLANTLNWTVVDDLVRDWQPQAMVVGLPLAADGSETDITRAARVFGEELQKRYHLETYWVDERLTSVEAERMIAASQSGDGKGKKRGGKSRKRTPGSRTQEREAVDRMAAKLILESWFNQPSPEEG